jgi:hypothetical protein
MQLATSHFNYRALWQRRPAMLPVACPVIEEIVEGFLSDSMNISLGDGSGAYFLSRTPHGDQMDLDVFSKYEN